MKYYIITILIALCTFTSCDKNLLDKQLLTRISSETIWKDEALINAYVLQVLYLYADCFRPRFMDILVFHRFR